MTDLEVFIRRRNDLYLRYMQGGMKESEYRRQRSKLDALISAIGPSVPASEGGILVLSRISETIFEQYGGSPGFYIRNEASDKTEKTIKSWPIIAGISVDWKTQLDKIVSEEYKRVITSYFGGISVDDKVLAEAYAQGAPRLMSVGSAAERIWKDHSGVILCECDNADCDKIIPIDHDAYIKACGVEGYYRITAEDCPHGCLNYYLSASDGHWKVWSK